ncbi:BrnT family toxin [Leptospira inadai]|uniref:BrnT family toxin n=1 Tax=Leptospira inadai serovar Lyme TaxID=293084 RepID=A0ABX4YJW5_9LEPT|nr:BrnT family toxin [Leptospira inadai]PNV75546.1 BrnT family toxin [Leptospira inadai serovar Lyme]
MSEIDFEWDPTKSSANKRKHGISFEEAKTVFFDENARVINDPEHSEDEERFVILGFSYKLNLLMVSHCYRSSKDIIRIISARKATKSESKQYEAFL